jgi:hypothetical protein
MLKRLIRDFGIIALGIGVMIFSLGADLIGVGSDSGIGLGQVLTCLFGFTLSLVGVDYYFWKKISRQFTREHLRVFLSWAFSIAGIGIFQVGILFFYRFSYWVKFDPVIIPFSGVVLLITGLALRFINPPSIGIAPAQKKLLKSRAKVMRILFWGIPAGSIVILVAFSEIARGAFFVFLAYCVLGVIPSFLFFLKDRRIWLAFAITPAIGFCLVSVLGSLLITLNFPVNTWASIFLFSFLFFDIIFLTLFLWKNRGKQRKLDWKEVNAVVLIYLIAFLMCILPVAIGGLKLSALRGNPADANNYMGMALLLKNIPFSEVTSNNTALLYDQNPIYPWAAMYVTSTRWTSSAVMAWSSLVAGISIFRFDFAYAALSFVVLAGLVYAINKLLNLSSFHSILVALSIGTGFYAQFVLDIRSLSEINALPIMLWLTILIIQILEGKGYFIEYLFVTLATITLIYQYPEILSTFGLGIFLFFFYCWLRRQCNFQKSVKLAVSAIIGILIALISQSQLLSFFTGVLNFTKSQSAEWYKVFFRWFYMEGAAGPAGLLPYRFNIDWLQVILSIVGWVLITIFITCVIHIAWRRKPVLMATMIASLSVGGMIIFFYFIKMGYLWQAGKAFTYIYPFLMLVMANGLKDPSSLENNKKTLAFYFHKTTRIVLLFWFLGQALLGPYRIINSLIGNEYPSYISYGGNTPDTYRAKYGWNMETYQRLFKSHVPTVWISSNYLYEEFLDVALAQDAKLVSTTMKAGSSSLMESINPPVKPPEYLLVSRDKLISLDDNLMEYIVDENPYFVLFHLPSSILDSPFIVGASSFPLGNAEVNRIHDTSYLFIEGGDLEFYSPRKGKISLAVDLFGKDGNLPTGETMQLKIFPGAQTQELKVEQNPVHIEVDVEEGLNIITFPNSSFAMGIISIE